MGEYEFVRSKLEYLGYKESEVVFIARVGSFLFVDDPRDFDYLAVVKDFGGKSFKTKGEYPAEDYFFYDEKLFKELVFGRVKEEDDVFSILCILDPLVIKEKDIVYGSFNYENNFFSRKKEITNLVKMYIETKIPHFFNDEKILPRISYWPIVILKFLESGNSLVTDEIKNIVGNIKNCKDKDESLVEWVRKKIYGEVD